MTNQEKNILSVLSSEQAKGPFVTIMLNTHVAHQDIEKDMIKFKNFVKESKARFEKKYSDKEWLPFQEQADALLNDADFWHRATTSVAIIMNAEDTYIHRLNIRVDEQYYVSDKPYLLAIIKNEQFNYNYFLLALNRDSFSLYLVENHKATPVKLSAEAPTTVDIALGDELTSSSKNYSIQGGTGYNSGSKEGMSYHSVNPKDEEVQVDWVNYYQAVDDFFKNDFENPDKLPLRLYALPENQAIFKKVAKYPEYDSSVAYSYSPAQITKDDVAKAVKGINAQLEVEEVKANNRLLDRKFIDQLVDMIHNAKDGRVSHLFIATSNLIDGFGENPEVEYDRRQVLNNLADEVIEKGGKVYVLEQKDSPDEKSLVAILRY